MAETAVSGPQLACLAIPDFSAKNISTPTHFGFLRLLLCKIAHFHFWP